MERATVTGKPSGYERWHSTAGKPSLKFACLALPRRPCTRVLRCSLSLHNHIQAAFIYFWSNSLSCRHPRQREHRHQPGGTHTLGSVGTATCSWDKLWSGRWLQFLSQSLKSELINFAGPAAGVWHGQLVCLHAAPLRRGTHHGAELACVFSSSF